MGGIVAIIVTILIIAIGVVVGNELYGQLNLMLNPGTTPTG